MIIINFINVFYKEVVKVTNYLIFLKVIVKFSRQLKVIEYLCSKANNQSFRVII